MLPICLQKLLPEAHVHLFQQSGFLLLMDPRLCLYFIKNLMFSPQPLFNTAKIADTNNEIIRCRVPLCEVKKVIGQMFLCVWGSPWWSFRAAIVTLVCMCRPRSSFAYTGQFIMYCIFCICVFVCVSGCRSWRIVLSSVLRDSVVSTSSVCCTFCPVSSFFFVCVCSVCFCACRVVFCCRNTPWVQILTSKSTSFFFIVGFYVKLLTCSQVWQLWTAGWAARVWVTGRPGPWTLSHRPTQGSNSTRLPPCPPSTASPYCSNRALRAARKRVWT